MILFCRLLSRNTIETSQSSGISPNLRSHENEFINKINSEYDVTLVSQSSLDRLFLYLPYITQRWSGPISICAALLIEGDKQLLIHFLKQNHFRNNILISFYKEDQDIYPINKLRNIAINKVTTSHFYISDIDLWPDVSLYSHLLSLPKKILSDPYQAIIIPAFEVIPPNHCDSIQQCFDNSIYRIPHDLFELNSCIHDNQCDIFKRKILTHNSTNYPLYWKYSLEVTKHNHDLYPLTCFDSDGYEPYIMVKKTSSLPTFDERFYNYGMNKLLYIYELRIKHYNMNILTKSFLIHIPHPKSSYSEELTKYHKRIQFTEMDKLMKKYLDQWKKEGIDLNIILPLCPNIPINPNSIWKYLNKE
ncbi:hypothetical protein WA158_006211 [Blastocystis sp. Blastoise]